MYTKKNVIFFHDDERVSGLIGKEVYYSHTPHNVLEYANADTMYGKLISATEEGFIIEGSDVTWEFIIGKKLEYRPFNSFEEFAMAYDSVFNGLDDVSQYMFRGGFWLIDKLTNERLLVKGYTDNGIILEFDVLSWEYALENFLMPDMTPYGSKEE